MPSLVVSLSRAAPPDAEAVRRGLLAAPHRGPERRIATLGRVACGVSAGDGPATASLDVSDGWMTAFAGRLDNLDDLAKALLDEAVAVDPATPASVVGALVRWRGPVAVEELRGLFEGAVTDGSTVWAFRDHFGFRPLFYRDAPAAFVAATEAKQVVAASGIASEPDLDAIDQILFGDFDDDTPSALRGVRRLPKSTVLAADAAGARLRRYWNPVDLLESAGIGAGEVREAFDELMGQAVARTLTGDDVISLSGGLDSPTVAAFAAPQHLRLSGRPLSALSAVYPDQPEVDESVWIEEVAEAFGMPLHTYRRSARPLEGLQEWTRLFDGPVPTLVINDAKEHYDRARELGLRTMLTGELAEFLVDQRRYLPAHLLRSGQWRPLAANFRNQRARGASLPGYARQLSHAFVPRSLERAVIRRRGGPSRRVGLPTWVDTRRVSDAEVAHLVRARDRWGSVQATLEGPGLTMEADEVCQEVCGIVSRRPWADIDLFEFFVSLPTEIKYQGTRRKDIVRTMMRGRVPDSILDRPTKTLFNASIMARIEYDELRRWLIDPPTRVPGIRYDQLAERLRSEDLTLIEYQWAKDLAGVQAFLALW